MQVTITNLSSSAVYVSQLYRQLAPSEAVTTTRTMAQIDADAALKTLISVGTLGIVYTEDTGDDIAFGVLESGIATQLAIHKTFAAGAGGSADDVVIFNANAPFAFDIVDTQAIVGTNVSGSTLTLRDTAAGGGAALSDALSSATTGVKRNAALTSSPSVAKGGSLIIRRSDSGIAGQLNITILRKS